jgi:hypothetical protein
MKKLLLRGVAYLEGAILWYLTFPVHLKSGLIRVVANNGRGLIRENYCVVNHYGFNFFSFSRAFIITWCLSLTF